LKWKYELLTVTHCSFTSDTHFLGLARVLRHGRSKGEAGQDNWNLITGMSIRTKIKLIIENEDVSF
jgi:hypothetical protein